MSAIDKFITEIFRSYHLNLWPRIKHTKRKSVQLNGEINGIDRSSRFIDAAVIKELDKFEHTSTFALKINDTYLRLCIYHKEISKHTIQFIFFYVGFLSLLMQKWPKANIIHELNVDIFMYNGKKRLPPKQGMALTPLHVNSGYTTRYIDKSQIVVYRREEVIKVLTHEFIHAFGLDKEVQDDGVFYKMFNVCKPILISEAFTDTLACYINSVIYAHITGSNLKYCLDKETQFILSQANKVLHYLGYHIDNSHTLVSRAETCEHTNVIAYYILKAIMFERGAIKTFGNSGRGFYEILQARFEDGLHRLASTRVSAHSNTSLRMSHLDIMHHTRRVAL